VRLAFDAGTILFPVSYIFGDVLTEVYGYSRARRVIWVGFGCLGISAIILWLIKMLPGEASWQGYAGQEAYDKILSGMSSGGIMVASLLGYFAGEFSNLHSCQDEDSDSRKMALDTDDRKHTGWRRE